jgi:hypothetical protein
MGPFAPGKGFYGDLTQKVVDFIKGATEEVWDTYGDEGDDYYFNEDTGAGAEQFLKDLAGSAAGWTAESDKFGVKLYKALAWSSQADGKPTQYRVTVVARGNALHLDIRSWYQPQQ